MPERTLPSSVIIRGMGLSCALGIGVGPCLARLGTGRVEPVPWVVRNLETPFSVPFYPFPGGTSASAPVIDASRTFALLEQVVREAVESAGLTRQERDVLPIFIGTSAYSLDRDHSEANAVSSPSAREAQPPFAYEQISDIVQYQVGCGGETFAFQTACTSSANAVISAARMIRLGWYRHALVVGVEVANLATVAGFSSLQLIARALRPFDRDREGIVIGEGIGAIVLSASADDAAGIHVLKGGSSIDLYRLTASNPDGVSAAALQESVLRRAGLAAAQILGIKAHATGSVVNDAAEAAAIRRVFPHPPPVCALKSYVGHMLGACGVNELVLLAASLRAGVFPATAGFETPDPALGITPTREAGVALDGHYLLNYFGFGGHNTVLLVAKRS